MLKLIIAQLLFVSVGHAQTYVHGYTRSNGTYVEPHYRSAPDHTTTNNYSNFGNSNPYTGQIGRVRDNNNGVNLNANPYMKHYGDDE